jgi:hypothetical protein
LTKSPFANEGYYSVSKIHRPHLNTGPQITPRLEALLRIVGQQGALRYDHVQRWLGRLSPEPTRMKQEAMLSTERTRKVLRPWIDEGLFCYRTIFARQLPWLWLSSKGLKYSGLQLRIYEPSPANLAHLCAINDIRLLLADRRPKDIWRSEREVRAELYSITEEAKRHMPDAELITEKGIIALEIELTIKSQKRLHEILLDLSANTRYYTIWYFAPDQVRQVLIEEIKKLPPKARAMYRLYDLQGKEQEV